MKIFWTIFFLGSMVVAGLDVRERRQSTQLVPDAVIAGDAAGVPTPRPGG